MFFELFFLKVLSLGLYSLMAIIIWDVVTRRFLMEKVFSLILVFFLLSFVLLLNGLEFLPLVILLLYIGAIAVLFLFVVMILNPDFLDLLNQKQQLVTQLHQRNAVLRNLLIDLVVQQPLVLNNKNTINYTEVTKELQLKLGEVTEPKSSSNAYNSSFFLGLLLGSFMGGVFSWYQYCNCKFMVSNAWVHKLLQVLPIMLFEDETAAQLGSLQRDANNIFAEIKMQAYYYPSWVEKNEMVNIGLLLYTKYGVALVIIGVMLLVAMMGAIILTLRQTTLLKKQSISLQSVRYTN